MSTLLWTPRSAAREAMPVDPGRVCVYSELIPSIARITVGREAEDQEFSCGVGTGPRVLPVPPGGRGRRTGRRGMAGPAEEGQ